MATIMLSNPQSDPHTAELGDLVEVLDGKHKGKQGRLWRRTPKMVEIQVNDTSMIMVKNTNFRIMLEQMVVPNRQMIRRKIDTEVAKIKQGMEVVTALLQQLDLVENSNTDAGHTPKIKETIK
jgi:hypothetical protein